MLNAHRMTPNATPPLLNAASIRIQFRLVGEPLLSIPLCFYHQRKSTSQADAFSLERLRGIEPLSSPWQGEVLPLNHSREYIFSLNVFYMLFPTISSLAMNTLVPRVRIELTT
jgi:hypothetical protein